MKQAVLSAAQAVLTLCLSLQAAQVSGNSAAPLQLAQACDLWRKPDLTAGPDMMGAQLLLPKLSAPSQLSSFNSAALGSHTA